MEDLQEYIFRNYGAKIVHKISPEVAAEGKKFLALHPEVNMCLICIRKGVVTIAHSGIADKTHLKESVVDEFIEKTLPEEEYSFMCEIVYFRLKLEGEKTYRDTRPKHFEQS